MTLTIQLDGSLSKTLIGFIDDAPADMAERHDEYLYGAPKA